MLDSERLFMAISLDLVRYQTLLVGAFGDALQLFDVGYEAL